MAFSTSRHHSPRPPKNASQVAVEHSLRAPLRDTGTNENFITVIADAMNAPFRDHSIDTLVTPWLIDILPDTFDHVARRMNRLLKIGGEWRIFGPLSYNTSAFHNDLTSLTEDEIQATLENSGYQVTEVKSRLIPYLSSESLAQKREETVWLFTAKKTKHEKEPPAKSHLPDWIIHPEQPIPVEKFLMEQLGTLRLQSEAISLINGQNSLQLIAVQLAARYGAPENIAVNSLRNLFSSLIETRFAAFR